MSLLEPELLRELEVLARAWRAGRPAGVLGPWTAQRVGGVSEFADRRPYTPGDETRHIDWLAYARRGQPVIKRFHTEESNLGVVLLDCSASQGVGSPRKFDALRRLAAAIAYLWLASGSRVRLITSSASDTSPLQHWPERRGRAAAGELFGDLLRCEPMGQTDLADWVRRLRARQHSAGALVVLSDWLDPGPVLQALSGALRTYGGVGLVQVLAPDELAPSLTGQTTLRCVETAASLDLDLDDGALAAYRRALHDWVGTLAEWARRSGQSYVRLSSDADLSGALRRLVNGRIDPPP